MSLIYSGGNVAAGGGGGGDATAANQTTEIARLTSISDVLGTTTDVGVNFTDDGTISGRLRKIEQAVQDNLYNIGQLNLIDGATPERGNGTAGTALGGVLRVTIASDSTGVVAITDNAGSITVDNPVLSVVGGGTEATAQRVTIANDSTGVLSVDDNGASITVDAPVGTPVAARLSDGAAFYDATKTGQLPAALVGGRLDENVGAWLGSTAPTVGSKTSAASIPVVIASDQGAVTTTNTVLSVVGGGTEAAAQRVTIANDSTGVLSVDDNGGSLTVDGTVTANAGTAFGKTLTYISVSQGAAGTTVLAAASPSNKHKVIGAMLVADLAGTLKFTDGAGDLTGAMSIAANGGFVIPASILPMIQTSVVNTALSIVSTLGAFKGIVTILTEP